MNVNAVFVYKGNLKLTLKHKFKDKYLRTIVVYPVFVFQENLKSVLKHTFTFPFLTNEALRGSK